MAAFETVLGRKADGVIDFIAFDSWKSFDSDAGWSIWGWKGSGYKLLESVPLTVRGTSLEDVAAGKYDAHYSQLARTLISNGFSEADVRLGWEFNGGWYPWSFKGHEQAYADAFRRVVRVMRATRGQNFRFIWCPNLGMGQQWPDWTYPGDDVIDVIAMDVYNQSWKADVRNKTALWNDVYGGTWGVAEIIRFAAKHGKPYAFPEWGTGTRPDGHGGGDDANFIQKMAPLVARAELSGYWDFPAGDYDASFAHNPEAAGAFRHQFGGTGLKGATTSDRTP